MIMYARAGSRPLLAPKDAAGQPMPEYNETQPWMYEEVPFELVLEYYWRAFDAVSQIKWMGAARQIQWVEANQTEEKKRWFALHRLSKTKLFGQCIV